MEVDILETKTTPQALRKVLELGANEDIFDVAWEIQGQMTRMKKELHASQEER